MAYNYYPNNQFYMQDLQNMRDRIDTQMRQIQQQNQQPVQQPITQNFQEEIVEIDEKDREIAMLKKQIQEMKEMISNESNVNNSDYDEPNESKNAKKLPSRTKPNAK